MSAAGLPRTYKFVLYNDTGVTIATGDVDISIRQAKYDSDGALSYAASAATRTNAGTIATNAYSAIGSNFDNSSDLYLGFDGTLSAVTTGSGDVSLWLAGSPDGGTTFPDNGEGILLAVINFTAAATKVVQIAF